MTIAPQIRHHTSILTFLNSYFDYRKKEDSTFTYEKWSKELGFSSSAFMYLVSHGQRSFTVGTAKKLIPYLGLNPEDQKHILLLALYSQSKNQDIKNSIYDKILNSLSFEELRLVATDYKKFFTSPTMPLIRMIIAYNDIVASAENIKKIIHIGNKQLNSDLSELEKMGLAKKVVTKNGSLVFWKSVNKSIKFPEKTMHEVMDLFYSQNAEEVKKILKTQSLYKKFRSLVVSISPDEYSVLEEEIENFTTNIKKRFSSELISNKHLLKLHLQSYQVSRIYIKS